MNFFSEILSNDVLQYVANQLGDKWKSVALLLDFSPSNVKRFEYTNPFNQEGQIFSMLCEWRDSWAKQRIDLDVVRQRLDTMDKALVMVGRADLADFSEAIDFDDYESGCWEDGEDDSASNIGDIKL